MKSNGYPLDLRNRGFLNEISNSAIKDSSQKEDSVNDQPNQATTAFRCTLEKLVHCCQHLTTDRNLKTQGQTQSTTDYDYVPQNQTLAPSRPQSLNSCSGNQSLEDIIFAVLFHIMTSWSQKSVTQPRALFRVPSTLEQVIIVAVEAEFVHDCFDLIEAACHIQTTVVDTLSNRSDHKWVCLPIHAALRAVGTLLRPTVQQAGCSWELCFLIDKMSSTEATLMPQHVLGYHGIRHRAELWHLQRELKFFRHRENTLLQREAKLRAFCGVYDITLEQLDTLPNISPEKVEETSLFFRDYYTLTTTPPRSTSPCQRSEEDLQTCCVDEVENSAVDEARHHAIIPPVKSKNKTVLADTSNAGGGENAQWIQTHLHELETLQLKNLEDALRFQNTVRGGSGPWAGAEPEPGTNQTLRSSNHTMQTSKSSLKIFGVQKPAPALLSNVQSFGPVCTYTDNSAHITKLNSVSTGLDHPTQAESKVVNGSTNRRVLELSSIEGCSSDSESITSMSISTTASVQPSVRNGVKL